MSEKMLFIGDPHLSSYSPARRVDDYKEVSLNKLKWSIEKANSIDAVPVILGDLFDRSTESNLSLLSKTFNILSQAKYTPVILAGNHDLRYGSLFNYSTLEVIHNTDIADIAYEPRYIETEAGIIYAVPYGNAIPSELDIPVDAMITHHDLAFETYEKIKKGNLPLKEIKNCPLVVNGHLHGFSEQCQKGKTLYLNAGSLVRLTRREKDHAPAVWEYNTDNNGKIILIEHEVPHQDIKLVMDLSDDIIERELNGSNFAEALSQVNIKSTNDISYLREELSPLLEEISEKSKDVILEIFDKASDIILKKQNEKGQL